MFSEVKTTPLIYDIYYMYLSHPRIQSHSPECLQMNLYRQRSFDCLISGQMGVWWTDDRYCQTTNQPCSSDIIISWENVQRRFAGRGTFLADKTLFPLSWESGISSVNLVPLLTAPSFLVIASRPSFLFCVTQLVSLLHPRAAHCTHLSPECSSHRFSPPHRSFPSMVGTST